MAFFVNPTTLRALLLAAVLAGAAALMAPTARGSVVQPTPAGGVSDESHQPSLTLPAPIACLCLAEEWSWSEFVKFWKQQMGSMNGVVGTVLLVGAGAVVMILWKGK
jgi:uncharacterized membrane protein YraQ (UPF0718 family)